MCSEYNQTRSTYPFPQQAVHFSSWSTSRNVVIHSKDNIIYSKIKPATYYIDEGFIFTINEFIFLFLWGGWRFLRKILVSISNMQGIHRPSDTVSLYPKIIWTKNREV